MKASKHQTRHAVKRSILEQRWLSQASLFRIASGLKDTSSLPMLADRCRSMFEVGITLGKPLKECLTFLTLASKAYSSTFLIGMKSSRFEIQLDERNSLSLNGPVDESCLDPGTWMDAFWTISFSGSPELLEPVLKFSTLALRKSSTRGPEAFYDVVDALRACGKNNANRMEVMVHAIQSSKAVTKASNFACRLIPQLQLLTALESAKDDFQSLIQEALVLHKKFWTSSLDERLDPHGFISIELCFLLREARKRGIECRVSSDYVPSLLWDEK